MFCNPNTLHALRLGAEALAGNVKDTVAIAAIRTALYELEDLDQDASAEYEMLRQMRKTMKENMA